MVENKGLEPLHLSIPVPKTGVSAIPPILHLFCCKAMVDHRGLEP